MPMDFHRVVQRIFLRDVLASGAEWTRNAHRVAIALSVETYVQMSYKSQERGGPIGGLNLMHGPLRPKYLAKQTGLSYDEVQDAISELAAAHFIEITGTETWNWHHPRSAATPHDPRPRSTKSIDRRDISTSPTNKPQSKQEISSNIDPFAPAGREDHPPVIDFPTTDNSIGSGGVRGGETLQQGRQATQPAHTKPAAPTIAGVQQGVQDLNTKEDPNVLATERILATWPKPLQDAFNAFIAMAVAARTRKRLASSVRKRHAQDIEAIRKDLGHEATAYGVREAIAAKPFAEEANYIRKSAGTFTKRQQEGNDGQQQSGRENTAKFAGRF